MLVGRTPHLLPPASAAYKGFTEVLIPLKELLRRRRLELVAPAWGPLECRILGGTRGSLIIFLGCIGADEMPRAPWVIFVVDCEQEKAFPRGVNAMECRIVVRDPAEGVTAEEVLEIRKNREIAEDVLATFIAGLCAFCYEPVLPEDL